MPPILQSLLSSENPSFHLDASGLAGFFGGQEAVSAMNTAPLYEGRRWLGWYNSPGGYEVAKHFGQLAKSPFWRGLCPGARIEAAELFGLNVQRNPQFLGVHTGVDLKDTGHLGYLFFKKVKGMKLSDSQQVLVGKRQTTPQEVTVVELKPIQFEYDEPATSTTASPESRASSGTDSSLGFRGNIKPFTASIRSYFVLIGSAMTILVSLGALVLCALHGDWFAFTLILLGVLANGIACCIFGSGKVKVNFVSPPQRSPPGDGLMMLEGQAIMVIGAEREVYQVTRASISVEFPKLISCGEHFIVGCCSALLMLQLLAQILLVPQATLFGQVLFLGTFAVSWAYNTLLSAVDKDDLLRNALRNRVWDVDESKAQRYKFPNRTVMAIASLYLLRRDDEKFKSTVGIASGGDRPSNEDSRSTSAKSGMAYLLHRLLPNHTPVWQRFKKAVLEVYPAQTITERKSFNPVPENQEVIVENMYEDWPCAVELPPLTEHFGLDELHKHD